EAGLGPGAARAARGAAAQRIYRRADPGAARKGFVGPRRRRAGNRLWQRCRAGGARPLGAASRCGIDIENEAVVSSSLLLRELDYRDNFEFHRGDMWRPVAGRRFDLIAANLPHFPMEPQEIGCRLASWSSGGADGRALLDRFLEGVPAHLAPGGRAVMTHNGFLDLDLSRSIVEQSGLSLRIAQTVLV